MNLDIETTVRVIFFLLIAGATGLILVAIRAFREAKRLRFFLKKRELLGRGWQFVFFSLLAIGLALLVNTYAEPLTYQVFPPSPTVTLTPTITITPTVTITPTITLTPTASETPQFTPTPLMPAVISQEFTAIITPNPEARFSELQFSRSINDLNQALNPSSGFENPIETIYGAYTYENMVTGSQWTALWFRESELIYYQTIPWNGGSGGYGFTDSELKPEEWLPGSYEVQIYVGETFKQSGSFEVIGNPPTPEPTATPTQTLAPTITLTPTNSQTATLTLPPILTKTNTPENQLEAQAPTDLPTNTATPTEQPTASPTITATPTPFRTATITRTPTETLVPAPTRRSTIYR